METLLMKEPIKLSNNLNNKKTNSDSIKLSKGQYSIMLKILFILSLIVIFIVIKIILSNILRLSSLKKENEEIIQRTKDATIRNKYLMAILQDKHKIHSKRSDVYNSLVNNIDAFKDKLAKLEIEQEQLKKKLNDLTFKPKIQISPTPPTIPLKDFITKPKRMPFSLRIFPRI